MKITHIKRSPMLETQHLKLALSTQEQRFLGSHVSRFDETNERRQKWSTMFDFSWNFSFYLIQKFSQLIHCCFFYKNIFYKNTEGSKCSKIKNMLRIILRLARRANMARRARACSRSMHHIDILVLLSKTLFHRSATAMVSVYILRTKNNNHFHHQLCSD